MGKRMGGMGRGPVYALVVHQNGASASIFCRAAVSTFANEMQLLNSPRKARMRSAALKRSRKASTREAKPLNNAGLAFFTFLA